MQRVKWIGFGVCGSQRLTELHLVARSARVSAPYPVKAVVKAFLEGSLLGSASLEGVRLHQPLTVDVFEVFPILRTKGIAEFGIELELSPPQPSIDLEESQLSIELKTSAGRSLYAPRKICSEGGKQVESTEAAEDLVLIKSDDSYSSLYLVNPSQEEVSLRISSKSSRKPFQIGKLACRKIPFGELESFETSERILREGRVSSKIVKVERENGLVSCFTAFGSERGLVPLQVEGV